MQSVNRRKIVGALFCALIAISQSRLATTGEPCIPDTGRFSDHEAIQECLSRGGLVLLESGRTYMIGDELRMGSNTALATTGGKMAMLLADPNLDLNRMLYIRGTEFGISNIAFDGNKYRRNYEVLCTRENTRASNVEIEGSNFQVSDVFTMNAPCGTGLGIVGQEFKVERVTSSYNGWSAGEWPYLPYQYGDGITVIYCNNGELTWNTLVDNSDFDLLFGGGPKCNVHDNTIMHRQVYGFGGLNIGHMNTGQRDPVTGKLWDGNHAGSVFRNNAVTSEPGKLMYGLSVGSHPFALRPESVPVYDAGVFMDNKSSGAQINLIVEGVERGELRGNRFETPRGDRDDYNICKVSANYIAGHLGFAPQGGYTRMTIDGGQCQ